MAGGRTIRISATTRMELHNDEFERIRKVAPLKAVFEAMGQDWVDRLNAELHAAQKARKQKVEDGYTFHIHDSGTRMRMYVVAATARAQAHERKHSSILKLMRTSSFDVDEHSAATQARMDRSVARRRRSSLRARPA